LIQNNYITKDRLQYAYSIAKKIENYQQKDNEAIYKAWRTRLKATLALPEKPDNYLKYALRILKKCCNICFDGKSTFSKDIVFYRCLNKDKALSEEDPFKPIELNIDYDPRDELEDVTEFDYKKKYNKSLYNLVYNMHFKKNSYYINIFLSGVILFIVIFMIFVIYICFYRPLTWFINYIIIFIIYRIIEIPWYIMFILYCIAKIPLIGYIFLFMRQPIIDGWEYTISSTQSTKLSVLNALISLNRDIDKAYYRKYLPTA
jgi:hypothetical protein